MKKRKVRIIAAAACLLFVLAGLRSGLRVRKYAVTAEGFAAPVRVVLLSDLHSCRYGEGEEELIAAIRAQVPDLILMTGDIFDDRLPDDNAEALIRGISPLCPCLYVTGNHEYWAGDAAFAAKMAILEQYGVTRLSAAAMTLTVKGTEICLAGIDDPVSGRAASAQLSALTLPENVYTILLSHRPELTDLYAQYGFDLVLCGHAHGGQWRLPGLLNGVYAPNQGLFPAHAGGLYRVGCTNVIVSRGLSRESTPIPRFYNPPELVVIDITP